MKLSHLVSPESIFIDWPSELVPEKPTKWQLIESLTLTACQIFQIDPDTTKAALAGIQERETSMTTGIGSGIAIPHASLSLLTRPIGAICILPNKINFESIDKEPVTIVILILVPKNEFQQHIRTLASIARLMNDEDFRVQLTKATTGREAYDLICSHEKDT